MFNVILAIIEFIFLFGMIPVVKKLFGKQGLVGYMVFCTIVANIQVLKVIDLGLDWLQVALGNVAFAAIFTTSDVLNHNYSAKDARKGVHVAVLSYIVFFITMQLTLLYKPAATDYVQSSLKSVFGTDGLYIWVSIGSLLSFYIGQLLNTYIFSWLVKKIKSQGKIALWFKSGTSSMANIIENFIFGALGYVILPSIFASQVVMPFSLVLSATLIGSLLELIITVLSPLFLIIASSKLFKHGDEELVK